LGRQGGREALPVKEQWQGQEVAMGAGQRFPKGSA
jgi:hypothetical protein